MLEPASPINESQRQKTLDSYRILDTTPEIAFDQLTQLAAKLLNVPIVLVSIIDSERQWFKSHHGLDATETPRNISFCGHVVAQNTPLVVKNASTDERFSDNPLVCGPLNIRFYAGFPLRTSEGHVLGTLCAIDHQPRELSSTEAEILFTLANEVMAQFELRKASILLREEQAQLEAVLHAASDAVLFIDTTGTLLRWNATALHLFGYAEVELRAMPLSKLLQKTFEAKHLDSGYETLAMRKDGSTVPCEITTGKILLDGGLYITGIIRDISNRKELEATRDQYLTELHSSHKHLLQIISQMQVGIVILDPQGSIAFSHCAFFSLCTGKLWNKTLLVDTEYQDQIQVMLRTPEVNRTRITLSIAYENNILWLELEIRDDPRMHGGHILYFYDVTKVHSMQERINHQTHHGMIGDGPAMRELYSTIQNIATGEWTVLIEGETGTGKELVARAIHHASPRRKGPFVAVNCAGLSESLLGSQLFGHTKGAFTGATADKEGFFEAARGGCIFLDEIGDISPLVQITLLRVLQEREITRLGEVKARPIDVRIILATHRNLASRVSEGLFREDLFYRMRSARIQVPPLREHKEDIPPLVRAMLAEERVTGGKLISDITPEALDALMGHSWPGNVRELRGAIEYAVVHTHTSHIEHSDLPKEVCTHPNSPPPPDTSVILNERERIIATLLHTGGNRKKAATRLQMSRTTLYRRIEKLQINEAEIFP